MHRDALTQHLEDYLQASTFSDYCHNGLQVEGKEEIKKVATAVSANLQTIEQAVKLGVDALITHHGMFWKGDAFELVGAKKHKLQLLMENDLSLFAYHLPLDAHQEIGNNWKAARDLGWSALEPFGETNGSLIGVRGRCTPKGIEDFVKEVEEYYGHKAHAALHGSERVEHVALISGGAYRNLKSAADAGLDCFITGNFDEPAWGVSYEERIHFLALGHSATEEVGPKALAAHLREKCGLEAEFLVIENPF